jgi:leucyl aminopeptidase
MNYKLKSGNLATLRSECLVVGVFARGRLSDPARQLDEASSGHLTKILKRAAMNGEPDQILTLLDVPGIRATRVMLVGCGKPKEFDLAAHRKALGNALGEVERQRIAEAVWTLHQNPVKDASVYRVVRDTVLDVEYGTYRFDQMKSDPKAPKRPLRSVGFAVSESERDAANRALAHGQAIGLGVALAKDLGNLPGNVCTPTYLAEQAVALAKLTPRLKVTVLDEGEMQKLGMGALLAVSRGSRQPAKLIVMNYQGGKRKDKPVVLVGKGLTFDAGGISIKPAEAMDEMKYDMCGGGSVIGTLRTCIELGLPINLVGVVPSSENLPDGDANKPGDILTSMSGQTIEVLNTDAEGRLILCDALTYSERFDPDVVIDIATLTGACIVALGSHPSGLMSNNDDLSQDLLEAGEQIGDRAWRLPIWDDYQKQLDSPFADMANIGGRKAGAITAGCFLARFTKKMRWAHLDIAGTAWTSGEKKLATGRPVPLLSQYLLTRAGLGD